MRLQNGYHEKSRGWVIDAIITAVGTEQIQLRANAWSNYCSNIPIGSVPQQNEDTINFPSSLLSFSWKIKRCRMHLCCLCGPFRTELFELKTMKMYARALYQCKSVREAIYATCGGRINKESYQPLFQSAANCKKER